MVLYPSNGVSDIFIARGPHVDWETVWGVVHLSPDESCLHHPEMGKLLRKWVNGWMDVIARARSGCSGIAWSPNNKLRDFMQAFLFNCGPSIASLS